MVRRQVQMEKHLEAFEELITQLIGWQCHKKGWDFAECWGKQRWWGLRWGVAMAVWGAGPGWLCGALTPLFLFLKTHKWSQPSTESHEGRSALSWAGPGRVSCVSLPSSASSAGQAVLCGRSAAMSSCTSSAAQALLSAWRSPAGHHHKFLTLVITHIFSVKGKEDCHILWGVKWECWSCSRLEYLSIYLSKILLIFLHCR